MHENALLAGLLLLTNPASPADWDQLARKRIFFGHQSVGRNIIAGIRELPQVRTHGIRLISTSEPRSVVGAAFMDANIGENGTPLSKTREFSRIVAGMKDGIALHKYCYVDVDERTDVTKLFADYQHSMREIRRNNPMVTIVHVTMPLTVRPPRTLKSVVKSMLGREAGPDLNEKRNEFNRRLVATYRGKEPVFDLAELESTDRNGKRVFRQAGNSYIYSLAPEWTDDGGHLNTAGRKLVARKLLEFLAQL